MKKLEALSQKVNSFLQRKSMLCFKIPKAWFVIHYRGLFKILHNLLFANTRQWQLHVLGHTAAGMVDGTCSEFSLAPGPTQNGQTFGSLFKWVGIICLKLVYAPCKIKEPIEFWCRWGRIGEMLPNLSFIHPEDISIMCQQSLVVNFKLQFFHVISKTF